jgi:hypothetical protein
MFHLLLESLLPEFHHYLKILTFSTLHQQFQPQSDKDQVLTDPIYIQQLEVVLPLIENTVEICKQITILIRH